MATRPYNLKVASLLCVSAAHLVVVVTCWQKMVPLINSLLKGRIEGLAAGWEFGLLAIAGGALVLDRARFQTLSGAFRLVGRHFSSFVLASTFFAVTAMLGLRSTNSGLILSLALLTSLMLLAAHILGQWRKHLTAYVRVSVAILATFVILALVYAERYTGVVASYIWPRWSQQ